VKIEEAKQSDRIKRE